MTLQEVLSAIHPADAAARQAALDHWSTVAHPLHSLGLLEDAVVRIAAVQGTASSARPWRAPCPGRSMDNT